MTTKANSKASGETARMREGSPEAAFDNFGDAYQIEHWRG